jgi:hypothetical protein
MKSAAFGLYFGCAVDSGFASGQYGDRLTARFPNPGF